MGREYSRLSCGCLTSCDSGGGLLGKCSTTNCLFNIWLTRHQTCFECNECLNCGNHDEHFEKLDINYLKSILGM